MERKILNLEQHVEFLYEELENKEKEIDNLKKFLDDAQDLCRKKSTSNKIDQDDIEELKKKVEEQRIKIVCLRKHRDEILDRHEKVEEDYEYEFKAKENDIKHLQGVSENQKKEIIDLKEELAAKVQRMEELESTMAKKDFESESSALSEELKFANFEDRCDKLDIENKNLKLKVQVLENGKQKRALYLSKMDNISGTINENLKNLESSLSTLIFAKEKVKCTSEWKCNRIFCIMDHTYLYRKINDNKGKGVQP